jgi:hypothetical protein
MPKCINEPKKRYKGVKIELNHELEEEISYCEH